MLVTVAMVGPVAMVGFTVAMVVSAASGATAVVTAATVKPPPSAVPVAKRQSVARAVIAVAAVPLSRVVAPVATAPVLA